MTDPFKILGYERARFHVDAKELERAYLDRSRKAHPDRFATKSDAERREAAQRMVALNDAYRAIQEPFDRATWLVKNAGVDAQKMDQRLLVEFMELRETADESAEGKAQVVRDAQERFAARMSELGEVLRITDDKGYDAPSPELEKAARLLAELKTLARLVDDLGGPKLIATLDTR